MHGILSLLLKNVFHIATGSQMIDYRILLNDRAIMRQVVAAHYNAINPTTVGSFPIFLYMENDRFSDMFHII